MDGMYYRPERNDGKVSIKRNEDFKLIFMTIVVAMCVLGFILLLNSAGVDIQAPEEFPYTGGRG